MSESDGSEETVQITEHWGEIVDETTTVNPQLQMDIMQDIKRSTEHSCLDMYPDEDSYMCIENIELPAMDPLVMYAIQLHKWMNNITEKISVTEVAIEGHLKVPEDPKVPIPKMPEVHLKHKRNNLNFIPTSPSEETECDIPELNEGLVKELLAKSAAVLLAQIGFEDSFQSVLDTLVDVLEQFFKRFCSRFTDALREEEELGAGGFSSVAERLLVEMGVGGAKGLHNYYQSRVIKYVAKLQKRCHKLEQHYSNLTVTKPQVSPAEGVFTIKKEETMDVDA